MVYTKSANRILAKIIMTKIINGKEIASKLRQKLKEQIFDLKNQFNKVPGLAVIQIGNNPASSVYVKAKTKNAKEIGIEVIDHHLEESIKQDELKKQSEVWGV